MALNDSIPTHVQGEGASVRDRTSPVQPSFVRTLVVGLLLGALAMSWWVAFDRGRQWRDEALQLGAERQSTALELDRLRQERDANADLLGRATEQMATIVAALERCPDSVIGAKSPSEPADPATCSQARAEAEDLEDLLAP